MAEKKDGKEAKSTYMCAVCGHISIGRIPVKCPGCGAGKENFQKVA